MNKKLNILILEDNPTDVELIKHALRKEEMQYESTWVDNRPDFITALSNNSFDVILSDNSLPQFEAREAVQIVRNLLPDIPFILVTGTVHEDFIINIMKLGIDDYILKDRLTRLPSAIYQAISNKEAKKEKQLAEIQLRSSEAKYRFLIEHIEKGIYALDKNWRVLYMNKTAAEIFECNPDEIAGKVLWDEYPQLIGGKFYNAYKRAMQLQQQVHIEDYSEHFKRWATVSAYPSSEGLVIIFDDITEKKEIQLAYQKSQEQYREMVERITDAFISLDKNFNYVYLNKQAAELIQKNADDLIGKNVWDIFPDAVGSKTYHSITEALTEQKYVFSEDYYEPLDLWQENHIYPSTDGLSIFIRDISARKRIERSVKQSEEVRNLIMSSALDAIICVNNDNKFIFWNKRAEELFGWTFEEIKNQTLTTTIVPPQHRHAHDHAMAHYLVTGEKKVSGRMLELTALKKSGKEFPIELFMIPVKTGDGEFFCAFIRDISERKELQQKLIDQQQKAAREITATALDAQEKERNFIGQELHDNINQILVGTKMMLQLTTSNVEKNKHLLDKCVESLDEVIKENRKLAHEMVTPNIEQESLHNLLQTLTTDMFVSVQTAVNVFVHAGIDQQLTNKQKLALYRIAQEQCANILKYAEASEVHLVVEEKNQGIEMSIRDNGKGMETDKKPNGIGLRNINSRLSIYSGTSKIISAPGEGFTLFVYIPL
ncbi:PAS domain S-box-containing protein [Lacibacter cauensis]|uniref:histidine kinase n=1 Tax=Lacibacter cauensis TaxID=510947 RepID=A0A562SVY2_9BACT|nr:PAS domain S-box protein [Lacibacter cauensis]TWI85323.1 PAS domain S-box-containing protein [Lacibacter cauensis]